MTLIFLLSIFCLNLMATDVFRIEVGKSNSQATHDQLRERVWKLEQAVWQLQQKVFNLENRDAGSDKSWVCRISAMGDTYMGYGPSKALASARATEECTKKRGDGFFCSKNASCEQ